MITETFAQYFASVGSNQAKNIPKSALPATEYLKNQTSKHLNFLLPAGELEILSIISNLKSKKSTGTDNINTLQVKQL